MRQTGTSPGIARFDPTRPTRRSRTAPDDLHPSPQRGRPAFFPLKRHGYSPEKKKQGNLPCFDVISCVYWSLMKLRRRVDALAIPPKTWTGQATGPTRPNRRPSGKIWQEGGGNENNRPRPTLPQMTRRLSFAAQSATQPVPLRPLIPKQKPYATVALLSSHPA